MVIDFPGVTGVKRRPTVVVSSPRYHASRPDIVVGLITSQTTALGPTDYVLQDWAQAGLRVPSVFRSGFRHTAPRYPSCTRWPSVGPVGPRLAGGMRVCENCSGPLGYFRATAHTAVIIRHALLQWDCRTLMRFPVVKRQTTPKSGFFCVFPAGFQAEGRPPLATCSGFISVCWRTDEAAPNTS